MLSSINEITRNRFLWKKLNDTEDITVLQIQMPVLLRGLRVTTFTSPGFRDPLKANSWALGRQAFVAVKFPV